MTNSGLQHGGKLYCKGNEGVLQGKGGVLQGKVYCIVIHCWNTLLEAYCNKRNCIAIQLLYCNLGRLQ